MTYHVVTGQELVVIRDVAKRCPWIGHGNYAGQESQWREISPGDGEGDDNKA